MSRTTLLYSLTAWLFASLTFAADDPDVEGLWRQWKAGDEEAYRQLRELGPETGVLAWRILKPEGEVFPKWPTGDESFLLYSMEADAVPAIARAIERSLPGRRTEFFEQLEFLGPLARRAGGVLMQVAMEEHGDDRERALRALASVQARKDYLIPELIRMLARSAPSREISAPEDGPNRDAFLAAFLLSECPDPRAREALVSAARFHPCAQVRENAIQALVVNAPDDNSIIRTLVLALDDNTATLSGFGGSGSVSDAALNGILHYQELPANVAPGLIEKLYRGSYERQGSSAAGLCEAICRCPQTSSHAEALVTHKLRGLLDDDAYFVDENEDTRQFIRVAAASVVLKWNPEDRIAAEFLAGVLRDTTERDFSFPLGGRLPDVRAQAANGLGRIGEAAREWLPLLHDVMDREAEGRSELAFNSAWAIAQIDQTDEECLDVLREAGFEFLAWRQMPWSEIERVLGDRARSLIDIDEVLTRLADEEFLRDKYDYEWLWLCLQPHSDEVVPVLHEHAGSDQIRVRVAAAEALGQLRSSPSDVVLELVALLGDARARVRAAAAEALGGFGPAAADAVPALERAADDDYLTVQLRVEDALAAIRGDDEG